MLATFHQSFHRFMFFSSVGKVLPVAGAASSSPVSGDVMRGMSFHAEALVADPVRHGEVAAAARARERDRAREHRGGHVGVGRIDPISPRPLTASPQASPVVPSATAKTSQTSTPPTITVWKRSTVW